MSLGLTVRPPARLPDRCAPQVAPSIQGVRQLLERKMTADKINHMLETRPSVGDLKATGIYHQSTVADSIVAKAKAFERQMKRDLLNTHLETRAHPEEVSSLGVMSAIAPSIQSKMRSLQVKLTTNQVRVSRLTVLLGTYMAVFAPYALAFRPPLALPCS